jgi:hypothetical protein
MCAMLQMRCGNHRLPVFIPITVTRYILVVISYVAPDASMPCVCVCVYVHQ